MIQKKKVINKLRLVQCIIKRPVHFNCNIQQKESYYTTDSNNRFDIAICFCNFQTPALKRKVFVLQ